MKIAATITFALVLLTGLVFAVWPSLDIAVASLFRANGVFIGDTPVGGVLRKAGYMIPAALLIAAVLGGAARGFDRFHRFHVSWRALVFLAATMALGPGLLVNAVLKDNSHRPRPVQVKEFAGPWEFRPWYRFDGQCNRNCSFVSGETSSAMWTLAPALLAPAPVRPYAIVASIVFAVAVSALRMAFGGHFLSDAIFSGLFTILVVLGLYWLLFRRRWPKIPD